MKLTDLSPFADAGWRLVEQQGQQAAVADNDEVVVSVAPLGSTLVMVMARKGSDTVMPFEITPGDRGTEVADTIIAAQPTLNAERLADLLRAIDATGAKVTAEVDGATITLQE